MKNLKIFKNLFAIALISIAVVSCSDDTEIDTNATLKISAGYKNTTFSKTMDTGTLTFDSGYIWVSELEFDGTLAGGGYVSRTVERFSKIDFATGIASPSLDDVTIPSGEYVDVDLSIELRDEDSQPSIVMEGTYTRTNGTMSPIRFEYNSGETFEAESDQQVSVGVSELMTSRIVFDPLVWFSVISTNQLDNARVNGEGVIVINGEQNEHIFDLVADRLDVSTESIFE